ncbi:MAG: dipeptidase PepE [Bacteroidales bacterium]|nr:dipeptidase PepE [Bacteroidales bacterium]MCF8351731.1 dipeptidase PepE [Bacteroidales bacterium]MCF8376888.1 dipeptidase PepE [Bacteroidales bacterium]MCF8401507.1 dipeptidase PepE [Bacteroidales bacterium]
MKLLLISNSTNAGEEYLGWPREAIKEFLNGTEARSVLFIPFAGVGLSDESLEHSFDAYEKKVKAVYSEIGYDLYSIHKFENPIRAVEDAEAIAVGGGNTFYLVYMLHKLGLMKAIREKVLEGTPYMGWSAGSNVACPSLRTTNDMPIIEPENFGCFNLIPFQINPHYLDANPDGHAGETRQQRIEEFLVVNREITVAGLRESSYLLVEDGKITLGGAKPLRLFKFGEEPKEFEPRSDLSFLI